jgi:hypothetical protein
MSRMKIYERREEDGQKGKETYARLNKKKF